VDNILVTEGLFTATLDFGQQFATTEARFLQIEVRADTGLSCANPAGLVLLGPRQPLTAAPMANHAKTAFSLAAADGSPAAAVFVDNNGQVGIGTLVPTTSLNVQAPTSGATPGAGIRIQGTAAGVSNLAYLDFYNSAGARMGYVGDGGGADNSIYIQSDSANVHLYTLVGAALTATPSGNVGVGTTTPAAKLDVRGDVRLGSSGEYLAPGGQENLRIVRGIIAENGSILEGVGFSVSHPEAGRYIVTFSTPFADVPAITANADRHPTAFNGVWCVLTDLVTASSSELLTGNVFASPPWQDRTFQFIAIGPR
jgi:hypothetical protein